MAVVGAGSRGTNCYAPYALYFPNQLQITAVAEPNEQRRKHFSEMYNVPLENQFESWEELFEQHKANAVLIANDDAGHYGPILKAMEQGWHILAEKPITNNISHLLQLKDKILSYDKLFMVCHVLRYSPFFKKLKEILNSKQIGEIVSIQHNENVGHFHQAHSFVRGNWGNSKTSSPMILAKCCHDMDILNFLIDKECLRVSSFGSLSHFKKENAPEGATEMCLYGCPHLLTCPYSAARYLEQDEKHLIPMYADTVKLHWDSDDLAEALFAGPYGRCVYYCDNDVVDHQVVNLEYENNITVAFTMSGLTDLCNRTLKIMGTKGEIRAHMEMNEIISTDFRTGIETKTTLNSDNDIHGGGDAGTIIQFIKLLMTNQYEVVKESNRQGILGHLMSFAAEKSRLKKCIVEMNSFI